MTGELNDLPLIENYRQWPDKGEVIDGRRLTIMFQKRAYQVNEAVRIVHVMEVTEPGHDVYVMGPKEVFGETINDVPQGPSLPDDQENPFIPLEYDGRVLESPATDFNYEVSVYSFSEPGNYEINWQPGKWQSNLLSIEVIA